MPSDKDLMLGEGGLRATNDHGGSRARSPSSDRARSSERFTLHDFNFIKVLGKGSFGKVSCTKEFVGCVWMCLLQFG